MATGVYQTIYFEVIPISNGFTPVFDSTGLMGFIPNATGVYQVNYNSNTDIANATPVNETVEMRALVGGVQVPGSQTTLTRGQNTGFFRPMSNTFLATVSPTGAFSFELAANTTAISMAPFNYLPAQNVNPSITISIVQIQ